MAVYSELIEKVNIINARHRGELQVVKLEFCSQNLVQTNENETLLISKNWAWHYLLILLSYKWTAIQKIN